MALEGLVARGIFQKPGGLEAQNRTFKIRPAKHVCSCLIFCYIIVLAIGLKNQHESIMNSCLI
jgi:hypothetical protein